MAPSEHAGRSEEGASSGRWLGVALAGLLTLVAASTTAAFLAAGPRPFAGSCPPRPGEGVVRITAANDGSNEVAPSADDPHPAQTARECREARWASDIAVQRYETATLWIMAAAAMPLLVAGAVGWPHALGRGAAVGSGAFLAAVLLMWMMQF